MCPSDKDIIIIDGLISTGQLSPEDVAKLEAVKSKPGEHCSAHDAAVVADVVRKALRKPKNGPPA